MAANRVFTVVIQLKAGSSKDSAGIKPGQLLAPKAQKETEKGLAGLKSGNLNEAQKHLEAAYKLAPTNADVDFLLGYLYLQKNDAGQAKTYFVKATTANPQHVRALTALGQLLLDEGDYKEAATRLESAVAADAGHWQAHSMLASAYLHQHEFENGPSASRTCDSDW